MYWNFSGIITKPGDGRFSAASGPISVEIGFGNGEYLQYLASSRTDSTVIGIEVSRWCISKAARRMAASGLNNVRIMCGDAKYLLKYSFESNCVREIYMNFPCPWPKRRHAERRVAREDFANLISSCLEPGGWFVLATDVDWYAEAAEDIFARDTSFETEPIRHNEKRDYATKYERKWRSMNRDIFELRAVKRDNAEPDRKKEDDTAHMEEMEISAAPEDIFRELVASLRGDVVEGPDFRTVFRDIFWDGQNNALVKIISVDEGFEQHYYLRITQHDGKTRIMPDSVGHPYKTPAVRAAARHAAKKLAAF
jgi:tRNA (guanine-N7-)-methyltransferase